MSMTSGRRWLMILVAVAFAALPVALLATHSWGGYHWARTSNPFTLKLGDNVSSTWDPILNTTSTDWSKSTVLDTTIVAGSAKPRNCRPTSGRVEVCNATYGNTGWLGVAQIWISGLHITQGTVKLNDTYFNTPTYNTTAWRNLVSCQEVGHTLGLDHQDENFNNPNLGTCMDYTNDPSTNQHPNQHDYDELVTIYSHLDTTTTVGQTVNRMPPAANEIDLEGPGQWGRVVRGSRAQGFTVHELDFGGGNKVITFVTWVR
ncbi:MAG: hypothetical protein ACRD3A_06915 [Terriglobales bacterium]